MTDLLRADVVKKGDAATLHYRANADLTGTTLTWLARKAPDAPTLMSRPASVDSVENGTTVIAVDLTPTQTATVGTFLVEIEAIKDGEPHTFPSEGYLRLRVIDDLS